MCQKSQRSKIDNERKRNTGGGNNMLGKSSIQEELTDLTETGKDT